VKPGAAHRAASGFRDNPARPRPLSSIARDSATIEEPPQRAERDRGAAVSQQRLQLGQTDVGRRS